MKKVIVFGASNSKVSINKQLAGYAATLLTNTSVEVLDLNEYEMPIYSVDKEGATGIPDLAKQFDEKLKSVDGFIISFAEHNGTYSSAFKNIFDWVSRIDAKLWNDKPTIFMATSPGGRGGISVLETAVTRMPFHGAKIVGSFSLPFFQDNFKDGTLINNEFQDQLKSLVHKLNKAL